MTYIIKTMDDLLESLEGGEAQILELGFSGNLILSLMQFPDGHIEAWKVTP